MRLTLDRILQDFFLSVRSTEVGTWSFFLRVDKKIYSKALICDWISISLHRFGSFLEIWNSSKKHLIFVLTLTKFVAVKCPRSTCCFCFQRVTKDRISPNILSENVIPHWVVLMTVLHFQQSFSCWFLRSIRSLAKCEEFIQRDGKLRTSCPWHKSHWTTATTAITMSQ